jgi:hypothetical protein
VKNERRKVVWEKIGDKKDECLLVQLERFQPFIHKDYKDCLLMVVCWLGNEGVCLIIDKDEDVSYVLLDKNEKVVYLRGRYKTSFVVEG